MLWLIGETKGGLALRTHCGQLAGPTHRGWVDELPAQLFSQSRRCLYVTPPVVLGTSGYGM